MSSIRLATVRKSAILRTALGLLTALSVAATLPAQTQPVKRALLIGIDDYAPPKGNPVSAPQPGHASDSRFGSGASWRSLGGPANDVSDMHELLEKKYLFTDIRELRDTDATRQGIFDAINKLVADTYKGDLVVFYFAGYGSQRLNTRSSRQQRDQTIVPVDAWRGVKDIRSQELALLFNKIVFDKQARLTAIFDSCNTGTMARGITDSVERTLPYDDDDVANEPGAVLDSDLKVSPLQGDTVILSAAGPTQSAIEARYPPDQQIHGAFTRALVRVLSQKSQALSAEGAVSAVAALMHADNNLAFQEPSVEGRFRESLFGEPVPSDQLQLRVEKVDNDEITLDIGSAAGFGVGTELTALTASDDGSKTAIVIKSVDAPTRSTATLRSGSTHVEPGQIFRISNLVFPHAARLIVFASQAAPIPSAAEVAATKALFPSLTWKEDPADGPLADSSFDFLVMKIGANWLAYGQDGKPVKPGTAAKGWAYLILGPPPSVKHRIERTEPFQSEAFQFTENPAEANYYLTMRLRPNGTPEYSLFDPRVLAARGSRDAGKSAEIEKKPALTCGTDPAVNPSVNNAQCEKKNIRSPEYDTDEAELNGGTPPEVVCRTDSSFPIRTAWLHDASPLATEDSIAPAIVRRITRLGKLRVWEQLPALATGVPDWPYHLAVSQHGSDDPLPPGPLTPHTRYDLKIVGNADQISERPLTPAYLYVFGFDCVANPVLLYPPLRENGFARLPQPGNDGKYPTEFTFPFSEGVGPPYGADTIFLLATTEKINDLSLIIFDGVIESRSRGFVGQDQLMIDLNDAGSRGIMPTASAFQVQQLLVPSQP